jgi:predicted 3-demethylubiquinone-9 3-methyltransferase (glyoxalase superfamily)
MKRLTALILIALAGCSAEKTEISVSTHLMFQGTAHEAIELYQSVFPEFTVQRKEMHEEGLLEGKVRLAYATFGNLNLIIFDSPPVHNFTFSPSMSIFVDFDDADRLREVFGILSEDGQVPMPLNDYSFSPLYGWVLDRYGVSWQLNLNSGG